MLTSFKKFIYIFPFFFAIISFGQVQSYPWAKTATGIGLDEGIAVCNDAAGNVYVTGQFTSPLITFGIFNLTNSGGSSVFLVKYNSIGIVVWAKNSGSTSTDFGTSVTTDPAGNVFISGFFQSPTITFGAYTLTNSGNNDIFLVKYDSNGNVLWARSSGGAGNDYGYSTKTDGNGNVYVAGSFGSANTVFGAYTLTNNGVCDSYLAKYDANGNVLWANNPNGSGGDETWSVCTDGVGNVFVTGDYVSPTITFGTYTITNTGICPIYIAKYDPNGNVLWAKDAGGTNYDYSNWITADANGDVIITGAFTSSTMVFGTTTLTNNGNQDVFIAKYSAAGLPTWAKAAGGVGVDKGYSLSTDANKIYCTGTFTNSIVFGTSTLTPPSNAPDPMFIVTFDYNGNVKCASFLKSGGDDQTGISADNLGNAYITSDFVPSNIVIGSTTLTSTGGENIFVAKYICAEDITGIENNSKKLNITLYPNPSDGNFKLQIENDIENGELILINALGQKILMQKIRKGENNFITDNLQAGLYHYMILQNKQQLSNGKLVFE
jgi:hypothetical protein